MKSSNETRCIEMLRGAGLSCTQGRIAILGLLLRANAPLAQDDIAERLSGLRLNRTTIYRTLHALRKSGLVHRAYLRKRAWHFELADRCTANQCHPHFTCTECGCTYCLTKACIPMVKSLPEGFIIHRQQVRLEGLCPRCM